MSSSGGRWPEKTRMARINLSLGQLKKAPPPGITALDMKGDSYNEWTGKLTAPADSPFAGILFSFSVTFPPQFPDNPPVVFLKDPIWHPNVREGEFCLPEVTNWKGPEADIVGEKVTLKLGPDKKPLPCSSVADVLGKMGVLLSKPDWSHVVSPLVKEEYDRAGERAWYIHAILNQLKKAPPPGITALDMISCNEWTGKLTAPDDSPFAGILFSFSVKFPPHFPDDPPIFFLKDPIWHPNVREGGEFFIPEVTNWKGPGVKVTLADVLGKMGALLSRPDWSHVVNPLVKKEYDNGGVRAWFDYAKSLKK